MLKGDCNHCVNFTLPPQHPICIECGIARKNYREITNFERFFFAENEEELMEMIFHALKMSKAYTDSRKGMVEWLKGTTWDYKILETTDENN